MEPFMEKEDIPIFYKYLDNTINFLEYGSGGSTYQASLRPNIKSITSVESDKKWIDKLREKVTAKFIYIDIDTKPNTWGHPGNNARLLNIMSYSESRYTNEDLILIDGRFRVACALKLWEHIPETTFIIFDDFNDRKQYHIVLDHFDIVEKGKRLVVLKKGKTKPSKRLIDYFELDPR
jgi:hypothetical protein